MEEKVEMSLDRFLEILEFKANYEKIYDDYLEILDVIFDNTELGYDNELRIDKGYKIMDYLKIKENYKYEQKLEEFINKKEEGKGNG